MPLSNEQVQSLLEMIKSTHSERSDCGCDSCYENLAEFAERQLSGAEMTEAMQAVRQHLTQCRCCCEEYNALMEGLQAMDEA